MSEPQPFRRLLRTLRGLKNRSMDYQIAFEREDAVTVHVRLPHERWTLHFLQDGEVETWRFAREGKPGTYDDVAKLLSGDASHGSVDVSFG